MSTEKIGNTVRHFSVCRTLYITGKSKQIPEKEEVKIAFSLNRKHVLISHCFLKKVGYPESPDSKGIQDA